MTGPAGPLRRPVAVVLAAGASSRFGAVKLLAEVEGRPLLRHVLDAVAAAGIEDAVVVLGAHAEAIEAGVPWSGERRIRNPDPAAGLAGSVRVGLAAAAGVEGADAAIVLLGDQPAVRAATLRALVAVAGATARPIVRARHAADAAPNPVLVRREAFDLAATLRGDRGLGPLLAAHPELVTEVAVEGANPDVDRPEDLARLR